MMGYLIGPHRRQASTHTWNAFPCGSWLACDEVDSVQLTTYG